MAAPASALDAKLSKSPARYTGLIVGVSGIGGLGYAGYHLLSDLSEVRTTWLLPFFLLGVALLVALGFEFVNGFHDTANAVTTVIYTHSLDPHIAVGWSGTSNFIGVLISSGAVVFGIVSLLSVELILQVGSGAGFAMVSALLVAAIIWNLGTWYFGLPSSSSHTLIGSIIGWESRWQRLARGLVRTAGQHDPCAFVGCGRNHGSKSLRAAMGDGAEPANGVVADVAGLDRTVWLLVLGIPRNRIMTIYKGSRPY